MKNDSRTACLTVVKYGPDSFGTRYVEVGIAVQSDDKDEKGHWAYNPHGAIGGIPVPNRAGNLSWRIYRAGIGESYRRSGGDRPQVLSGNYADASFHNATSVTLSDAEVMVKCLKAVNRRLAAMRDTLGHTDDLGERMMRVAAAFRVKVIAFSWEVVTEATGEKPRDYDTERRYKWVPIEYARSYFEAIARIDVTARCKSCTCPVPDGKDWCHDCRRQLEAT
jgi:hypothetical protein